MLLHYRKNQKFKGMCFCKPEENVVECSHKININCLLIFCSSVALHVGF